MKHIATIHISNDEIERVNHLLNIESLEDMSDDDLIRQGANTNYDEGIYSVTFDDGSSLNFDLCSGTHNYWDAVVWTSADGNTDVSLECEYELSDIEVEINGETYIVKIINDGQDSIR